MSGSGILYKEGPQSCDTELWQHAKPGKVHIMSKVSKNVKRDRKIQVCCCAQATKMRLFYGKCSDVTCWTKDI